MKPRRSSLVYSLLTLIWVGILAWQAIEHARVNDEVRQSLRKRAEDITGTMSVWTRSAPGQAIVHQDRLEAALLELVHSTSSVRAVALLNEKKKIIASAGPAIDIAALKSDATTEVWESSNVTIVTKVNLGNIEDIGTSQSQPLAVILPQTQDRETSPSRNGRRGGPPPDRPDRPFDPDGRRRDDRQSTRSQTRMMEDMGSGTTGTMRENSRPPSIVGQGRDGRGGNGGRGGGPGGPGGPGGRGGNDARREQFWRSVVHDYGAHSVVWVISAEAAYQEISNDLWERFAMVFIALIAMIGIGAAWRAMLQSSRIEARLIRASELNAHLQEMNLAAAGLAHETRNPLNIVRGQAQLLARSEGIEPRVNTVLRSIVDEVDRVTSRFNQFLDYSKPRQVKRAPTDAAAVARDIRRTMQSDMEDKAITFEITGPEVIVDADESMLRQVLFNLILNAVQAVGKGGHVSVHFDRERGVDTWALEVVDDGPGVKRDARDHIFRPYYTASENGTGLGLAVVRQIVMAHQWEIDYIPGDPIGSRFRIRGIKGSQKIAK